MPRDVIPKPNGAAPLDGVTTGAPGRPKRSSGSVSRRLARRSLTTSEWPSGVTETCAAPWAPGARSRAPPGVGTSRPSNQRRNATTFGVPPELSTYTRPWSSAMLVGATPREATVPASLGPR